MKAKAPSTKKELRSFLGLTNFYRKFTQDYTSIALPLTDRTKKEQPDKVRWDQECQTAFDKLKKTGGEADSVPT